MHKIIAIWYIILGCITMLSSCMQQSPPFSRPSLNHTALHVKDIRESAAFYIGIIGLDTIPEPFHDGRHVWFSIGPGISMHIIEGAGERRSYYKNQHTCFSVPSVEVFVANLKEKNIQWEDRDGTIRGITTRVDGVKQIWLQDPDGYWIEINDAKNN